MAVALNLEKLRASLFQDYLRRGLRDNEELDDYIREYLGIIFARDNVCPEHTTPFQFISDLFFERTETALGWGSRTSGKTLAVAGVLNHLDAVHKAPCEITSAAAILPQAQKGYRYFNATFSDPLTKPLMPYGIKSRSEVVNPYRKGVSTVEIITGTRSGLNSPHPNKSRIDELELMDWDVFQESLSMSMSAEHTAGQDVFTSTRKSASGPMSRLIKEADDRGIKLYKWCILEVVEKCTRQCKNDPVHGDCPVYSFKDAGGIEKPLCMGRAHNGKGHYKIHDLVKKARKMDPEVLAVQWFGARPSGGVLVYGSYFRDEHPWVVEDFEIPKAWPIYAGLDPQTNFSVVKLAYDRENDLMYACGEYVSYKDLIIALHSSNIRILAGKERRFRKIWMDPAGKQQRLELAADGLPVTIEKASERLITINAVRERLSHEKLKIFKRACPDLRKAFDDFEFDVNDDGTPDYDHPSEKEPDVIAALRYGVHGFEVAKRSGSHLEGRLMRKI